MFQIFHDFWVQQLPFFQDFYAMYYVLDLFTFIVFFRLLFSISSLVFPGVKK